MICKLLRRKGRRLVLEPNESKLEGRHTGDDNKCHMNGRNNRISRNTRKAKKEKKRERRSKEKEEEKSEEKETNSQRTLCAC